MSPVILICASLPDNNGGAILPLFSHLSPHHSTTMEDAILTTLFNLSRLNNKLYDHWIIQLYELNGERIHEEWNAETLKLMENDVMAMSILHTI
jgi:hypothetical protein